LQPGWLRYVSPLKTEALLAGLLSSVPSGQDIRKAFILAIKLNDELNAIGKQKSQPEPAPLAQIL
jgi:hypothetical protein